MGKISKSKRIFVSGSTGWIGARLIKALKGAGYVVLGASRSSGLDILDKPKIIQALRKFKPDVIIHLARDTKDDTHRVDIQGTKNLLDIARKIGVRQFIYTSSVLVYEETSETTHSDTKPLPKLSFHTGAAKQRAEEMVMKFKSPLVFRVSSIYDSGRLLFMKEMFGKKVYFEVDRYTNSYLHMDDAMSAFIFAIEHKLTGIYNLASFYATPRDIAAAHKAIIVPLRFLGKNKTHRDNIVVIDKIKSKGWEPKFTEMN